MAEIEPWLVHPDPPPPELVRTLELDGHAWKAVPDDTALRRADGPWRGAIVVLGDAPAAGLAFCRALRDAADPIGPVLLLVRGTDLSDLEGHHALFQDFCLDPFHPRELDARLRHLHGHDAGPPATGTDPEMVVYEQLALNLETYQAVIAGRPLDLTYMEYELLKHLAQHPGRVFTRETLLSQVWGYEYYGGARTVDVHVRRLRAKLGEEHAGLITTVRSVGYRFGESRWGS